MESNTKILTIAGVVGVAVFAAVLWWPDQGGMGSFGSGTEIIMKEKIYTPKNIRIRVGDRVTFSNQDSNDAYWPASNIHPTHEIYGEFDSQKPVSPGTSWSFVFDRKGEWKYHDHLFPEIVGTIVVE